jgi:hypothetical protein
MTITLKSNTKEKTFRKHLRKILDYMEPDERRHYEESYEEDISAKCIPLDKLVNKTHIYYSIRYIEESLKAK